MAVKFHSSQCRALAQKISEYLDGEVDLQTRRLIQRHLKDCLQCRTCLAMLQRSRELLRLLTQEQVPKTLRKKLEKLTASGRMTC
jgi:anti-sigma factor (TIGR02949 family)